MISKAPNACHSIVSSCMHIGICMCILVGLALGADDVIPLPSAVVDAEFDSAHGRMVLISTEPPRLHRWIASSGMLTSVDLPSAPTCVSISPDGATAAVGHADRLSLVDLGSMTVRDSWTITPHVVDIIHGGDGFAYVFPQFSAVNLTDGSVLAAAYPDDWVGNVVRKRPGSASAFGCTIDASPSSIGRYTLSNTSPAKLRSSPYWGDYPTGNDLWCNDAGDRILTASGNTFRATDDASTDMTYAGRIRFPGTLIAADHGGTDAGRYAVITAQDDDNIAIIDALRLDVLAQHAIPQLATPGGPVAAHGKWIFLSADGNSAYAVIQEEDGDDMAIASIDITTPADITISSPADGSVLGQTFAMSFATSSTWPPPAGGSVAWSLDGADQGPASSPLQLAALAPGSHTIAVRLLDHLGAETGVTDLVTVEVMADMAHVLRLGTEVIDAEFDAAHERMVLVSATPPQIHRWDAVAGSLVSLDLPRTPTCVSIGPDGASAAIGHDAHVSLVDLESMSVIGSWEATSDFSDIVLAGNGFAYAFPRSEESALIHAINLANGSETVSDYPYINKGTNARLRPDTDVAYGTSGTAPTELLHMRLDGAVCTNDRDTPFYVRHDVDGNFWFNDAGSRLLSRSGNIFKATDYAITDMTYEGRIQIAGSLVWADHAGVGAGIYAVIEADNDDVITLIDGDRLHAVARHDIPRLPVPGEAITTHGRWVFLSADGETAYAVVQADGTGGPTNNQAIMTVDVSAQPGIDITSPAEGAILGQSFSVSFKTRAWPPPAGGSVSWSLDGVDQGPASSPIGLAALASGSYAITVRLLDEHGAPTALTDTVTVQVMADSAAVFRLPTDVIDAEFDAAHDRMILVSGSPAQIHRWEAASGTLTSIDLPTPPTCVSISPDGATAAIGHDARTTLVDLDAMSVSGSWKTSAIAGDIIHAGNGHAYIFPRGSGWTGMHTINVSSGTETFHTTWTIAANTNARLHPGSTIAYGANPDRSPSDLERFALDGDAPTVVRNSPYHGEYPMGGDCWLNDAGSLILTSSGNLFRATSNAVTDMTYAGRIHLSGSLLWADHGGIGAGRYAVIPAAQTGTISIIHGASAQVLASLEIPAFPTPSGTLATYGRKVFLSNDGNTAYVLGQADLAGGLANDMGIFSMHINIPPTQESSDGESSPSGESSGCGAASGLIILLLSGQFILIRRR